MDIVCRQANIVDAYYSNTSSDANFVYASLGKFTTPLLLIAGQQDLVAPISSDLAIMELVPGATLVEVST